MAAEVAAKAVAGATPWGAIIGGVTSIVGQILGAKQRKKEFELQEKGQQFQQALSGLGNQQQYVLQSQLNGAKNDTERYAILTNAVTQIKLNQQTQSTTGANQKTFLIMGIMIIAVVVLIVLKRK